MGEQLTALVVPADPASPPEPQELVAYCRERLTHYKCPRSAQVVDALPRSAMGKLDKRSLRARFAAASV
jgi:long-chain acyl-CoA synthetase